MYNWIDRRTGERMEEARDDRTHLKRIDAKEDQRNKNTGRLEEEWREEEEEGGEKEEEEEEETGEEGRKENRNQETEME